MSHPTTHDNLCPGCAAEQLRRYRPGSPDDTPEITSPDAAADILLPMLANADREHCITLNLDTRHRLIAATTVSIGSIDHTFMSPREIYRDGLQHNAATIVLAHNHPSGDPEPSRDDTRITARLQAAGELIGIDILDHIVIGNRRWISLARRGALQAADRPTERRAASRQRP